VQDAASTRLRHFLEDDLSDSFDLLRANAPSLTPNSSKGVFESYGNLIFHSYSRMNAELDDLNVPVVAQAAREFERDIVDILPAEVDIDALYERLDNVGIIVQDPVTFDAEYWRKYGFKLPANGYYVADKHLIFIKGKTLTSHEKAYFDTISWLSKTTKHELTHAGSAASFILSSTYKIWLKRVGHRTHINSHQKQNYGYEDNEDRTEKTAIRLEGRDTATYQDYRKVYSDLEAAAIAIDPNMGQEYAHWHEVAYWEQPQTDVIKPGRWPARKKANQFSDQIFAPGFRNLFNDAIKRGAMTGTVSGQACAALSKAVIYQRQQGLAKLTSAEMMRIVSREAALQKALRAVEPFQKAA
jgi:hypothetical protein